MLPQTHMLSSSRGVYHLSRSLLGLVALLGLGLTLGVVGCSSADSVQAPGQAPVTAKAPASAPADAVVKPARPQDEDFNPMGDPEPGPAQPAPAARPSGGGTNGGGTNLAGSSDATDEELLNRASRQSEQRIKELEAAARWTLVRARELRRQGRFQAAAESLRDIMDVLRSYGTANAEVQRMRNELNREYQDIQGLLGGQAPEALGASFSADVKAIIEEAQKEAKTNFEDGLRAMQAKEFGRAVAQFERVLEILRWAPYSKDLEERYQAKVKAELSKARNARRDQAWEEAHRQESLAREMGRLQAKQREEERIKNIDKMWGEALFNMNLKRYDTAERLADQILALDPQFDQARSMKGTIQQAKIDSARDRNTRRKLDMYRRLWADWYDAKIPLAGTTIRYPEADEWERIKKRAKVGLNIDEPAAVKVTKNTLATKPIDLEFDDADFSDVLNYVRSRSGLNIIPHPDIRDDLDGQSVTLQVKGLPLKNALKILLDLVDMEYRVGQEGIVWIVGPDTAGFEANMVVRLHDVRDLTIKVKDFPGTRIRLRGNQGTGGPNLVFEDQDPVVDPIAIEDLETIIQEAVMPDNWDAPASLQIVGGQLLVRNTPEVQGAVRDFLDDLRDVSGLVVTIESRFVTVDDMFLSDFGVDWRGLGGQSPGNTILLDDVTVQNPDNAGGTVDNGANAVPPGAAIAGLFFNQGTANASRDIRGRFENMFDTALGNMLNDSGGIGLQYTIFKNADQQFQLVINALQKSRNATILVAPRLSAFNTQRATLTVINEVAYVRDFSVSTAVSAAIADPIVDTIQDGLVLDVKPTVSNDRRFVTIELQPTVAQLIRPIPEFTTTLGGAGSTPVTIQIPELIVQSVQTTVMCPDGGLVVVGGLKSIRDIDRESSTPLLGDIPIIGALFRRKGRSLENRSLVIVLKAVITDLHEHEQRLP